VSQTPASGLLKVQGSSKLAFGATTAALVTLASGGTAVLVSHVAHSVTTPTGLPGGTRPPDVAASTDGLVVAHPAGTTTPTARPVDRTERALHDALTARHQAPRRTLTAPLVPLTPEPPTVQPPVTPPVAPPVVPPVVVAPVSPPVTVPVTQPDGDPTAASREQPQRGRHHRTSEGGTARHTRGRHAHVASHGKGRHAR
jgi:hypothetical protein